jgi:hypothetical protein
MFDLDKAIAEWRQQMLAAGITTPVPLDELESHLRDDVEQQVRSGVSPQQAFNAAVQQLGYAKELEAEFGKSGRTKRNCGSFRFVPLSFGITGLLITVVLNLLGRFVFHRHSSVFFSQEWWAAWFPNYIIWMSFFIIGLASCGRQRNAIRQ